MSFEAPKEIIINNYTYTINKKLNDDYFSYRCKKRKECNLTIKIKKDELEKIKNKESNEIKYFITSRKTTEHTCNNSDENKEMTASIDNIDISLSDKQIKNKAKELIIKNIDKPFSFHKNNLSENNYKLSDNQIKWLIQSLRENKYPSDSIILFNIENIKIEIESDIMPFCFSYYNNIVYEKNKYICDKYFILTTPFQINMFNKCSQLFFDATFKSCPRAKYQILNIAGYFKDIDGIIPLMYIPMSNKTERIYTLVLKNILNILESFNIDINSITKYMMSDFEKSLRNSIKNAFPQSILDGCYFHYTKLLWHQAKLLGLCKKRLIKKTKIFLFLLKLYPYIKYDDKKDFYTDIEKIYEHDNEYKNFLKYFKKNWADSDFTKMDILKREEYLNRTNNYLESFHNYLNNTLEAFHPKISYLIEKLKFITIKKYDEYKNSIKKPKMPKHKKFSIIEDIYKFITNYNEKYKTKLNAKLIIQSDEEDMENIFNISKKY